MRGLSFTSFFAVVGLFVLGTATRVNADASNLSIDRYIDTPSMRGGITGCVVEDLDAKKIDYERDADVRLMPASNRKLFTTAAVLGILGPDFTIPTRVFAGQPDASGTIEGDIYLCGGGDSLLSTRVLDDLAKDLAAHGVKKVTGGVVGDGSVFEDGPYGTNWGWDTLNDDYAPAICGLDAHDGIVTIDVTPGKVGAPVVYDVDPATQAQPVVDEALTVDKGTKGDVEAHHPWRQDAIVLTGTLPVDGHRSIHIPVVDPVLFTADLFRTALINAGVAVGGDASTGSVPASAVQIMVNNSIPMREYVASMNKPSDNLLAESLVRVIGIDKSGHGTYDAGDDAEMDYFKSIGVDTSAITLDDGSGVSRRNYVTARSIVQLLTIEAGEPYFDVFKKSLPIAGVDGTLRHRLVGTPAAGNLRAKTGTLTGASALSGYFTGASGKQYAFSLIMNNYPGTAEDVRKIQDAIVVDWVGNL